MANKKSKVKSYARRTKKGIRRVTGHDRKRNRNIAIGLGIGTSVLALGLGAKHLAKKKGLKGSINPSTPKTQSVSFTPNKPSPSPKPKVKPETPSATVAEVRQTTQAVVNKAKEIKADKPLSNPSPKPTPKAPTDLREATRAARQDAVQQAKVTIVDESRAKLQKRNDNYLKVLERQGILMQVEPESKFVMRPYFGANAKMNPNRELRKKAGKRLADAAKDLRSRGMYI